MPADRPTFERPVFIIAAPRSGSTMLFEALARSEAVWTLGGEAHAEYEGVRGWHPRDRHYESNRLTADDAGPHERDVLCDAFTVRLRRSDGARWQSLSSASRPSRVRFLEKTPKNALRVPLIKALFPDARFVFLVRDPHASVSSLIEAWRSGRFVTYRDLPGWPGLPWSLLLPPGWRDLKGAPLERIAAVQWRKANEIALADLQALPASHWSAATYDAIVADPAAVLQRVGAFADVSWHARLQAGGALPPARHTLTPPHPEKWRANEAAVEAVAPELEAVWQELVRVVDQVVERHSRDRVD